MQAELPSPAAWGLGVKKTRIRHGGFGFIVSTYKGGSFQRMNDKPGHGKVKEKVLGLLTLVSSPRCCAKKREGKA
jgi:hypothetical protein